MLMSAGIIPALVQILGNPSCILPKVFSADYNIRDIIVKLGVVCIQGCQSIGCSSQCIFHFFLRIL